MWITAVIRGIGEGWWMGCSPPSLARTGNPALPLQCDFLEVIQVGRREVSPPASTQRLPELSDKCPEFERRGAGGKVSHTQISRHGWAPGVFTPRRKRIDASLLGFGTESGNDIEPRPTKPFGGKESGGRLVQTNQHASQHRANSPPSR